LELLTEALAHLRQGLLKLVGLAPAPSERPGPAQRTRQLLDGSTLAILMNPPLAVAYPPASNQSGKSDWSLMRIVVGFCARSGAVLSALEGAMQRSEQAMLDPDRSGGHVPLWAVDRNFGVWSGGAGRGHGGCAGALTRPRGQTGPRACNGEDHPSNGASRSDQAHPS
jgi:hypothetical protein